MVHTIHYILFSHRFYCSFYQCFVSAIQNTSDSLRSQATELLLHLAKGELYWIVVRCVSNVKDPSEAQTSHSLFAFVRCMNR